MLNYLLIVSRCQSNLHNDPLLDLRYHCALNFNPPFENPLNNYPHSDLQNKYQSNQLNTFTLIFYITPHIEIQMHSASTRFNTITLFTFTVLGVMCLLNFFQGYLLFNPKDSVNSLEITQLTNFISTAKWDQASFKYSLNADFSKLYNWNLKQLYVYIQCEWYNPEKNLTSRTIASDFILEIPQNKADLQKEWSVNITNAQMDYLVRDVYNSLRGTPLKFSVNVQYMPIVGFFFKARLFQLEYQMPLTYANTGEK